MILTLSSWRWRCHTTENRKQDYGTLSSLSMVCVCIQLEEKYTESRAEVMALHRERESYEENMKKAFMRGVCALNMEAMNMFHETDQPSNSESLHYVFGNRKIRKGLSLQPWEPGFKSRARLHHSWLWSRDEGKRSLFIIISFFI